MASVPIVNSAALLILQQTSAASSPLHHLKSGADDIVATASGVKASLVNTTKQPTLAESKVAESLFSINAVNINKEKLDLIDRTGKALGVDQADYASRDEFVHAMKKALSDLKAQGGDAAVRGLEKDLGLDELGVSIYDVFDSARDPEANDKLTKALEKKYGKEADTDEKPLSLIAPQDEIGLYTMFSK